LAPFSGSGSRKGEKNMKFEDKVISILLTGILLYAIGHRNNFFSGGKSNPILPTATSIQQWEDTIRYGNLVFIADSCSGLMVRDLNGSVVTGHDSVKPQALHLIPGQVVGTDTVDLLYCKTATEGMIPCFRIQEDGSLIEIKI